MKTYLVRLFLPTLGLAMLGSFVLELIDRTLLFKTRDPGDWAELGVWTAIFLAGYVLQMCLHGGLLPAVPGGAGSGAKSGGSVVADFFKGLVLFLVAAVVIVVLSVLVNTMVLHFGLGLASREVPWLEATPWITGVVLGGLLYRGPALQSKMAAEAGG